MNRESKATKGNQVLADSIKRKLDKTIPPSIPPERSIFRVSKKFCDLDRYAFSHSLWSIVPFHHSSTTFEVHKLRYARELLSQITPTGTDMLEECVACVKTIEFEARKCYSEHINLSSDGFVEMMVIDGLFIIELFRKNANISKIEPDDPIFDSASASGLKVLRHDLVLLENQLPMTVLNCLFNVLALNKEFKGVSLNILALRFFHELLVPQGEEVVQKSLSGCEAKHLLDRLGKTFHNFPKLGNKKNNSWKSIPSVTKLKLAGVRFVVSSKHGSFLDIKFKDGVMEIPPMVIKYETDTLIRNLIAYEQCSGGKVTYNMTSYGFLMDSLIKSGQDVRVLRKQGILKNYLKSQICDDGLGAAFLKKFCRNVPNANFNYSELCDQVNSYYETRYETRWHRRVWRILRDSLLGCICGARIKRD